MEGERHSIYITKAHTIGKNELFCNIYKCPSCNESKIIYGFVFCPVCGKKLEWTFEERV